MRDKLLQRIYLLSVCLLLALPTLADSSHSPRASGRPDAYVLTLGEQRFDPLRGVPAAPAGLDAVRVSEPDLHLVQFVGPTQDKWLEDVRAEGLKIVQYVHPCTYIVWGEANSMVSMQRNAAVRWNGSFLPAYRLLPRHRNLPDAPIAVRALLIRAADANRVVREIEALGARVSGRRVLDDRFEVVGFKAAGSSLQAIACIPGVYSVQPVPTDGGLRGEMSNQVCVNNLDVDGLAFPGYLDWLDAVGLTGAGVIIANVDSGIQDDHPGLVERLLPCTGATCGGEAFSSHGTHTAGIMAADGASGTLDDYGFLRGLGVAPAANLVEQVYSPFYVQPDGMRLLMQDSYTNGADLSGNSWGPSASPQGYDNDTLQVDLGVRDADPDSPGNQPLTYVLSFMNGNGGTSSQGTPDEAKNILTVGSTKLQTSSGAQQLDIDDLSANSAHGPALDGRKIPHIVAPGCYVDSTTPTDSHGLKCGTSMSSPHVSGAVALFIEYYRSLPDYVADPSPALIKAAFLPVARDLAGHLDADGGVLAHRFDSKQGWGRLDIEAVVDPQAAACYFDDPQIFDATGEAWVQAFTPDDPNLPVKIMLTWTDAAGHGLGGSTPAWNNDLDLIVETNSQTYYGNNIGADGWSQPGGSADYMHNTEGVLLAPGTAESFTLRIAASNINSDGIPSFGDNTDQDFALVCYNCVLEPGFALGAAPNAQDVCAPDDAVYQVEVEAILGFADPVTLDIAGPLDDMTAEFSPNPVTPPGTAVLTISGTDATASGEYSFEIIGTAGEISRITPITLQLYSELPEPVTLSAPADGATDVLVNPTFEWSASDGASSYAIQVASDADFYNVLYQATELHTTSITLETPLEPGTEYFWRAAASNACGDSLSSEVFSFMTRVIPSILLVDDDDNGPDVRSYYTELLTALGHDYDVWDTENSDNEPDALDLRPYATVIWFTGDEFGGSAGPGAAGETALAAFLADGKNLFISSQDYFYDRGLTTFIDGELGVEIANSDVSQVIATGSGSVFGGLGPYGLVYPFGNFSDRVSPDASAEVAFVGNAGDAGVNKDDAVYRTVYLGFPLEAISTASHRAAVLTAALDWFRPFIDCNQNGVADHADIATGTSADVDGSGVPDECEQGLLGDMNCDGMLDTFDIDPFVVALATPDAYNDRFPDCDINRADVNGDGLLDAFDIDPFADLLGND